MPPSPAPLAAAAKAASGFKRPFVFRYDILKACVSELASTLRLSRDTDQVLFTEVPEPFSPEAARMALISDASGFVRTRFVAIADCVSNAHRFKSYCSEQFISAHVVEDLSAFTLAERIIASQQRAAASSFQQALFIPRIGSPHRAVVCPLRDIVDRLAPHSFPINFSFKQHCSGLSAKPDASAQPAPQCSAGLCFSDDVLAFTHLNTLIFRRFVNNVHQDVVVGTGDSGCKDGTRDEALFSSPSGIHFDARHGGWLIADTLNHCVRCVDPSALTVSTVSSLPFVRIASSSSVPTRTVPPVQLSHNPVKQLVFLAMRRAVSQLNLPIKLTHALEWIMTSLHFGRGMSGWRLGMSVSLEQFSEMSRFFRISEINSISHVPMWRPQRIYSDGSGGYVVVSQGSLFAWHLQASSAASTSAADPSARDADDETLRSFSQVHGITAFDSSLISAAMADGKSSICLNGSLYKLENKSGSGSRIKLLRAGVFDGAVSPSGQAVVSLGPCTSQPASTPAL